MIGVTVNALSGIKSTLEALRVLGKDFKLIELDVNFLKERELPEIKRLGKEMGIRFRIHGPYGGYNLASHDERIRMMSMEKVLESMEFARFLDSESVNLHPGHLILNIDPLFQEAVGGRGLAMMRMMDSLELIVDRAKDNGILVTVENMSERVSLGSRPEEIAEMVKTGCGFCFDSGHAHLTGLMDEFIEKMPEPHYLHVCDSNGRRDHLPVGKGRIDFRRVLKGMCEKDIILEVIGSREEVLGSRDRVRDILERWD